MDRHWLAVHRTLADPAVDLTLAAPLDAYVQPFERVARTGATTLALVSLMALALSAFLDGAAYINARAPGRRGRRSRGWQSQSSRRWTRRIRGNRPRGRGLQQHDGKPCDGPWPSSRNGRHSPRPVNSPPRSLTKCAMASPPSASTCSARKRRSPTVRQADRSSFARWRT